MKTTLWLSWIWKAGAFSPMAFLTRAIILAILYAISRMAGLQEYTTFLSGTSPNPSLSWHVVAALGLIHLFLYFGFILLVPIFILTAGLSAGWGRRRRGEAMVVEGGK